MRKRMSVGLRTWVLGAAATGLLAQSCPSFGQTKNSAPANAKKGASTPATARSAELPQLLAVPTELADPSSTILPASQVEVAQNEKSEVQKQLEMLYEKDGREMPEIKINMQPLNPAKTLPQTSPATRAGQPAGSTTQKPAPAATGYTKFQQPPSRTPASSYPSQPWRPSHCPRHKRNRNRCHKLSRRRIGLRASSNDSSLRAESRPSRRHQFHQITPIRSQTYQRHRPWRRRFRTKHLPFPRLPRCS